MKRNIVWLLSTISVLVLLFGYKTSLSGPLATGSSTSVQSGSFSSSASARSTPAGNGNGNGTSASTPSTKAAKAAKTKTSTVSGSTVSTRWGPVQVQLTVKGSKITKASVLQYPHGNGTDAQINNNALPILTHETIDAQSAKIDMVSGATYTSGGYVRSLQSALDQANL